MTTQAATRHRPKIGIYLTPRDREVMLTLSRYHLLREGTVHALCFPTIKEQRNTQQKLKRLASTGYIGRRFFPITHPYTRRDELIDFGQFSNTDPVYFLTEKGATHIKQPHRPTTQPKLAYLHHRLDIADVRACLELSLKHNPDITLAHWIDEFDKDEHGKFILHDTVVVLDPHTKQQRTLPIRPDACFILEHIHTGKQDLFFLEVDEGTESNKKRWKDKVLAYRAYAKQNFNNRYDFNGKGFRVLTINRSETGKEQDKRRHNLITTTYSNDGHKRFLFTTFQALMPSNIPTSEHILQARIWQRPVKEEIENNTELKLINLLFER